MTAAVLVAIAIFLTVSGIGIGIGLAVRIVGDRIADRITDTDHEHIHGSPL